jgi:adenosylmethionine-8-amino-7-oxononanoate aminotransferase
MSLLRAAIDTTALVSPLVEIDRQHLIHPVSSMRAHEARGATVLTSGKGMYVRDADGNDLLDAFAGLWCVNVGYGQDSIVKAATEQMTKLPYATGYFHFASEPAILLAERLIELAPNSLNRVYFTLGGSDAVDSAIRFITNYYNVLGKPSKKQFIALERGYHGSSSTGAGLTALAAFHRNMDLPLPNQHYISSPYPYRHKTATDDAGIIAQSVQELKAKVESLGGPDHVAAFFCEPIQGSGGVIVPPKGWLKEIRQACTELGILLVVDEVITGFGRTGPMFACEHEGVEPDLMTVAKGLTAGYAPMGAVLMSEDIYQVLASSTASGATIGHGYTYSGHPVSAAVGLEVLRLYTDGGVLANGQMVARDFAGGLDSLKTNPIVGDVRGQGLLGAIELVANKDTKARFDPALKLPDRLFAKGYENGVIFRAFGDNIIGLAPALVATPDEIWSIFERIGKTLDDLLEESDIRAALS